MTTKPPNPPAGLQRSGRDLWRAVTADYDLSRHELLLLREACRTADSLDRLQAVVDTEGVISSSAQGDRAHPALVELRQQRIAFARIFAALQIPLDDDSGRVQRRVGARGVYAVGA